MKEEFIVVHVTVRCFSLVEVKVEVEVECWKLEDVGTTSTLTWGKKKRGACEPGEVAGPGTGTGTSIDSTTSTRYFVVIGQVVPTGQVPSV